MYVSAAVQKIKKSTENDGRPVFHRDSNHSIGFGTAVVIKCHAFVDYIFSTFLPETGELAYFRESHIATCGQNSFN